MCEASQRLLFVASPDRHGRLLSKRSSAYMDWLVRTATSPLVPCSHGLHDSCRRARPCMDALSSSPLPHHLLSNRHALSDRNHPHRELHISQLPRPSAGLFAARRRLYPQGAAAALEKLGTAKFHAAPDTCLAPALCSLASSFMAKRCRYLFRLGFLRDHGAAVRHGSLCTASASWACTRTRPVSYRQPVWPLRQHDQ